MRGKVNFSKGMFSKKKLSAEGHSGAATVTNEQPQVESLAEAPPAQAEVSGPVANKNGFQHSRPTSMITDEGRRYLLQDGQRYTHAEWNKYEKKWLPEPKPVDFVSESNLIAIPILEDVLKKLTEIQKEILRVMPNLEVLAGGEQDKK